jgi:hypothetical protein
MLLNSCFHPEYEWSRVFLNVGAFPLNCTLSHVGNLQTLWRMALCGMLRCVALVRTDVSEEPGASIIRMTRIGELGTTLAVTSNRRTLSSSETSVLIPEDGILHSYRREKPQILHCKHQSELSGIWVSPSYGYKGVLYSGTKTPCNQLKVNRRFRRKFHRLQNRGINEETTEHSRRWHIPLKRPLTLNGLHRVISQNRDLLRAWIELPKV